ncbi:MAG: DUF6570 domain-containing protein [Candidatus Thiodiazotropha sp.]
MSNAAGFQCTAVAFIGLLMAFLRMPDLHPWAPYHIDDIVLYGHQLYENILVTRYTQGLETSEAPRYLGHWEIPSQIIFGGGEFRTACYFDIFYGTVQQHQEMNNTLASANGAVSFENALQMAVQISNFMMATFNERTIAIFHSETSRQWFIFDSHSLDRHGLITSEGYASLLSFQSLEEVVSFICINYGQAVFNISPVVIEQVSSCQNTTEITCNISKQGKLKKCLQKAKKANEHPSMAPCLTVEHESKCHINPNVCSSKFTRSAYKRKKAKTNTTYNADAVQTVSDGQINSNTNIFLTGKNVLKKPKQDNKKSKKQPTMPPGLGLESVSDVSMYVIYESFENPSQTNESRQNMQFLGEQLKMLHVNIKKYEEDIRKIPLWHCHICYKFLFEEQIKRLGTGRGSRNKNKTDYEQVYCSKCIQCLLKGKVSKVSVQNLMYTGSVPSCLEDLTFAERRMISQLQTYITLVILPGGQYAEKGLAIHFPLDMNSYFEQLLTHKNEHFLVLASSSPTQIQALPVEQFINYHKVKRAISWLRCNNQLYNDFPDLINCSSETCSAENNHTDSSVFNTVNSILLSNNQSSIIPVNYTVPEVDIEMAISSAKTICIPTQFNNPSWISEIHHGEELAFPWLFPLGCGGLTEIRAEKLSVLDYFNARLYNKDPRWRKDITYLMFAVNHMEQTKLTSNVEIQLRLRKSGNTDNYRAGDLGDINCREDIRANSFMFLKNIRGTVAYWADILSNLLSTVKRLGPPTLFITLSADDCNWPELKMLLYEISYQEALLKGPCNDAMRKDPLLTSLFFERRWKALFKYILKSPLCILGSIEDWFIRVEYQNRGSPHLHIFFWIANAPSVDRSSSADIVKYIDKVISTTLPSEESDPILHYLVKRLQTHHHTKTCLRRKTCRFGFPRSETSATHILTNTDFTNPYHRGHFYETKRNKDDLYINAYNPFLLKRWRANMDIQMVSGGTGLAYYVCTYIAKAEPDDLKEALCKTFQYINSQTYPFSLRKQMHLIGNCVLKCRRLSAQEAAARLGHLQLIWSSRNVVFLNTRVPEKRYKVLKPKTERDELPVNSTDIFRTNILDYYTDRPDTLESMSLFKFASWYTLCSGSVDKINSRPLLCERIRLKTLGKTFRKRQRFAIIRSPKFEPITDDYFYSLLMLHLPYRSETTLKEPFNTAEEAFIHKYESFDVQDIRYDSYLGDIERIVRQIRATNLDLSLIVAPNTHEGSDSNDSPSEEHLLSSAEKIFSEDHDIQENSINRSEEAIFHSLQVNLISESEMNKQLDRLTPEQSHIFNEVRLHFQRKCCIPLRFFITGGAGTGKSYLVRLLVEWLRLFTAPFTGADPVLVCGPTGMSAKNIGGRTLHTAFKLPVQHGKQPAYRELSSKSVQDLRRYYAAVHTVIIDEISMVSSETLLFIHRRLCTIKNNPDSFGGLNIIVIGDFFQLKPVKGLFAFENTLLWSLFDTYVLQVNMRQRSSDGYNELLNRIREGIIIKEDLNTLSSCLINDDNSDFNGVLRVYPTLSQVSSFNKKQQNKLSPAFVLINAEHEVHNGQLGINQNIDDFIPDDDRNAGGLPKTLTVSVGTRVMLIRNIATDQGLVNGALGFVQYIEFENENPVRIFVRFDDESIGRSFINSDHNAIGIERISQEFYSESFSIYRIQFPLLPAWATTIHKVQGITCERIVVDLGSDIFCEGQFYVALSRVKSLSGLGILALDPSAIKVDPKVRDFYENLTLDLKHTHN